MSRDSLSFRNEENKHFYKRQSSLPYRNKNKGKTSPCIYDDNNKHTEKLVEEFGEKLKKRRNFYEKKHSKTVPNSPTHINLSKSISLHSSVPQENNVHILKAAVTTSFSTKENNITSLAPANPTHDKELNKNITDHSVLLNNNCDITEEVQLRSKINTENNMNKPLVRRNSEKINRELLQLQSGQLVKTAINTFENKHSSTTTSRTSSISSPIYSPVDEKAAPDYEQENISKVVNYFENYRNHDNLNITDNTQDNANVETKNENNIENFNRIASKSSNVNSSSSDQEKEEVASIFSKNDESTGSNGFNDDTDNDNEPKISTHTNHIDDYKNSNSAIKIENIKEELNTTSDSETANINDGYYHQIAKEDINSHSKDEIDATTSEKIFRRQVGRSGRSNSNPTSLVFNEDGYPELYQNSNNEEIIESIRNSVIEDVGSLQASLNKSQEEINSEIRSVNKEIDFGIIYSIDDIKDSYVVEAYNDIGNELIFIEITITKRFVNINQQVDVEEECNLQNNIEDADVVIRNKEGNEEPLNIDYNDRDDLIENYHFITRNLSNSMSSLSVSSSRFSSQETLTNMDDEEIKYQLDLEKSFDTLEHMYVNTTLIPNSDSPPTNWSPNNNLDPENVSSLSRKYSSARKETIYDTKGNARINRVTYDVKPMVDQMKNIDSSSEVENNEKIKFIIQELKESENKYNLDLHIIEKEYRPYIRKHTPNSLIGKDCYIFGNIEYIYDHSRVFVQDLNKADDLNSVVDVFIKHKHMFELYPEYCKNKPRSEKYVKEFDQCIQDFQKQLDDRLGLPSYLLAPIQRLGKYILLLEKLQKEFKRATKRYHQELNTAIEIIKTNMTKGNDIIAIDSIVNCPLDKFNFGQFLIRNNFMIMKPKKFEATVFLFTKVVIFTSADQKNIEIFHYVDHIDMENLRMTSDTREPNILLLTDFTNIISKRTNKRFTYEIDTKTEKTKDTWFKTIEKILWQQFKKQKEEQQKILSGSDAVKFQQQLMAKSQHKERLSRGNSKFFTSLPEN